MAAEDTTLVQSSPELLPFFALPQLPRPWIHPSLAPLLKAESVPSLPLAQKSDMPPLDLTALTTATSAPGVGVGVNRTAKSMSWHELGRRDSSGWVSKIRDALKKVLESRILLARPPTPRGVGGTAVPRVNPFGRARRP